MSEWGIALIAAGSAILGSSVTGFFAWKAGHRQAAAAETAGQAQAAALISTVQATLDEQRRTRSAEQRRQTYAQLLTTSTDWETNSPDDETANAVRQAYSLVRLEGPAEVSVAASQYVAAIAQAHTEYSVANLDNLISARNAFIPAAQDAIRDA
ncbi:hypothetical protein ACFQ7J_07215 [Streptomyces sp. NPDC056501]|uniref:hypothetical protein n=1 Tax=Streptomyces sp. NPDC056501 TaxID=3345841 RepID=UPI0036BCC2F1